MKTCGRYQFQFALPQENLHGLIRDGFEVLEQLLLIIASRVSGVPELVTDSENGLLLPLGAKAGWRDTFERLAKNSSKLKELRAGAEKSKDRLSPNRIADEMLDLYRKTMGSKKPLPRRLEQSISSRQHRLSLQ